MGALTARDIEPGRPHDLLRLLVEAVTDYAIFALDPQGYILTWNPGARRFKGYTADEIIGHHFSIFYPPEDIEAGKPDWELVVAADVGRFEDEGWRLRKDGSRFWANVVITALRDENGEVVGYGKVTRDLTERRAAHERALEDARRLAEAEAANRTRAELLAAMSHEMRTPLNAIAGYTDLLEAGLRGPLTETQAEDIRRIRRSQQYLLAIVNDLLNFSRLEAGTVSYDIREFDAAEPVEAVRSMTEPLVESEGLTLETRANPGRLTMRGDPARVEQILRNLITNAVKFTPQGGRIVMSLEEAPAGVRIDITDTGIGIPEDRHETIFDPFVQIDRTLTSNHEGTGLGLAISRELARAMEGELTVTSEPGKGSTFTLWMPAGVGEAAD